MSNDNKKGGHLKVVPFKPRPVQINEELVAMFERAAKDAREGHIISAAIAFVNADHSVSSEAATTDSATLLLGAIARLFHRQNILMDDATTFHPHEDA